MPGAAICRQQTHVWLNLHQTLLPIGLTKTTRKTKVLGNTEFHRRRKNTSSYKHYDVFLMAHGGDELSTPSKTWGSNYYLFWLISSPRSRVETSDNSSAINLLTEFAIPSHLWWNISHACEKHKNINVIVLSTSITMLKVCCLIGVFLNVYSAIYMYIFQP